MDSSMDDVDGSKDWGSFASSSTLFPSTPVLPSRKRKGAPHGISPFCAPQLCSTFNESLVDKVENALTISSATTPTPEKKIKSDLDLISPDFHLSLIQEKHQILYESIKKVKPERKVAPSPLKKHLVCTSSRVVSTQILLRKMLASPPIMNEIFKRLSDGDLYRLSQVSRGFKYAILDNKQTCWRFSNYKLYYKDNKENYQITPPASPEKDTTPSPPRSSSVLFNKSLKISKQLRPDQSLSHCRKCGDICIVDNKICQCQNLSCGLIYCLLCKAVSESGPGSFVDICGNSILRVRDPNCDNSSSSTTMDNNTSLFKGIFNRSRQDSGFYSETEMSTSSSSMSSPLKVRKRLFGGENRGLFKVKNQQCLMVKRPYKERISYVEVVPNKSANKTGRDVGEVVSDPETPPKIHSISSKQSRKSLRRSLM